ncbi:protein UNUSUAL FLORAL ORGANS-like [Nicotiana tabacum]|uniref:Protein UNUSUAL FLORAL ORGANS-like n=1 Tax=Nicotiana tabacum TaxID=4097 RepID=A0A1S3YB72_TOBAC|nr:protein UNUSUAL FLORAL ORGANS [Nicotiana tomentosiformis]XP_016449455.1 PREDICTED: protein UNUSUAL FLORAL ORGANS-like [Nicotiana tabacum]
MEAFHAPISFHFPYAFPIPTPTTNFLGTTPNPSINGSPWMDTRIWSRLPHRLIDRIIAFLPPPAFFRARAVCKRFYALLYSSTFLELYLQVSPRRHWFIFFRQKIPRNNIYKNNSNASGTSDHRVEGYLFDPDNLSWFRLSFALIPQGFSPVSSSGGLICFVSDEAGSKNILLCNPLVGSMIPLPPTLRPRLFPSIGLTITNSSIDLAVAGDDLISPYAVKNLTTESFHIDGNGFYSIWGTTSSLPRLCSFESGKMVHVEGRFYCMNFSPFSVLSYDVATNNWCKIQAPMRRFLRSPCLVEGNGRLVLVAAVEKSKLNVPRSLRLWALQDCGTMWVEIERMPQQLYVQFAEVENGQGFNCVGHGQFVVIIIKNSDKALLFDFCKKRWLWIPPCPFVGNNNLDYGASNYRSEFGGELQGFGYDPRLAAPISALLDQLTLPFQSFN